MKTFSTFFKIVWKQKTTLILYLILFPVLTIALSSNAKSTDNTNFTPEKVHVGIIDRDKSEASKAFYNYLNEYQVCSVLEDSKDAIQDHLYYGYLDYVLVIPENFQKDLTANKDVVMESYDNPQSMNGFYTDLQINQLIKYLKLYLSSGSTVDNAFLKASETAAMTTNVTVTPKENALLEVPAYSYFYRLMPYVLISMLCMVLAPILRRFQMPNLLRRTECGSTPLAKRNTSLIVASLVLSVALWGVLILISIILYQGEMLSYQTFSFYLLNTIALLLLSISLSFLLSCLPVGDSAMGILSTVIPLACAFLGGVFVPLYVFSESMRAFCHVMPTYYYSVANEILSSTTTLTSPETSKVVNQIAIQFLFATVIFGIGILATKQKQHAQASA